LILVLLEYRRLKIHMTLSKDADIYLLYVNQIYFLGLSYKHDLTNEGDESVKYKYIIKFDD